MFEHLDRFKAVERETRIEISFRRSFSAEASEWKNPNSYFFLFVHCLPEVRGYDHNDAPYSCGVAEWKFEEQQIEETSAKIMELQRNDVAPPGK